MTRPSGHIHYALFPLACLYGLGTGLRNKLFDWGWLPSESFRVPVICTGNLAVGGTGKTPHTEYLIRLLQGAGLHVATLSRGYKRHTKGYLLASPESGAAQIGDEPCQMKQKFPDVRVAVDEQRRRGIRQLLQIDRPPVDVILLDDAFQHRYVKAGLNILLTDWHRLYCDDLPLPAGRLREPTSGARRADIVIITKCPPQLPQIGQEEVARRLRLSPGQKLFFSTLRYGLPVPLFPEQARYEPANALPTDAQVLLVTGIANPDPMLKEVRSRVSQVSLLPFPDHHDFSRRDVLSIRDAFSRLDPGKRRIVTTEKDATRLRLHPDLNDELKASLYALPIEVSFLNEQTDPFNQTIIDYVTTHPRNSSLPEE